MGNVTVFAEVYIYTPLENLTCLNRSELVVSNIFFFFRTSGPEIAGEPAVGFRFVFRWGNLSHIPSDTFVAY